MGIAEIEKRISDAERDLSERSRALEKMRGDFREAASSYAPGWIRRELEYHLIERNAGKVRKLGTSGTALIKRDLTKLLDALPRIIDATVGDDSRWPHRPGFSNAGGGDRSLDAQAALFRIVSAILGRLGPILTNHGLVEPCAYHRWTVCTDLFFSKDIELPPGLKTVMDSYAEEFQKWEKARAGLLEWTETLAREEARLIWEKC
jgi:hypothetical protein